MIHHACSPYCFPAEKYAPKQTAPDVVVREQEQSYSETFSSDGSSLSISSYSKTTEIQYSSGPDTYTKASTQISAPVTTELPSPAENNPYSEAILNGISAQLARDAEEGATAEELQSRLEAGLSGFLEGYNDALAQLEGLPGFTEEVSAGVRETYSQVLQGINDLAEQYGVESPVDATELEASSAVTEVESDVAAPIVSDSAPAAVPVATSPAQVFSEFATELAVIEELTSRRQQASDAEPIYSRQNSSFGVPYARYDVSESRHFDFSLTTADGDLVTIEFGGSVSGSAQWNADESGETLQQKGETTSDQIFNVVGELDEGELTAIKDLLAQIADISESFFGGDFSDALELAKNIQYNEDEIALFDTSLEMTQTEYGEVAEPEPEVSEPVIPAEQPIFEKVEYASQMTESMGKDRGLVADLVDWVAQQTHPRHPWAHHAGSYVRSLQA